MIQEDMDDFIAAAKNGDRTTLESILGWDDISTDIQVPEILHCLLIGNTAAATRIAESMTNRVAELYAQEVYNKRFSERDNDE